jgi:hypothetical protein
MAGVVLCLAAMAHADIEDGAYDAASKRVSPAARQAMDARLAQERQREQERERIEAEAEAQRAAAERAAWEALPYPVRLTQTRCTTCHVAQNYESQRHNRLGWEIVILRMYYLNHAPLQVGERGIIAAHLAQRLPAQGADAAVEALQQLAAVALMPLLGWLAWRLARSRSRRSRPAR